ncbi:MAG TPA: hypothetical protein VJK07_02735 [Candidatus Nanoarchaeia archaeon]|nr:hypothetical protein [Candidatus Nanoarchaeia archaeon]
MNNEDIINLRAGGYSFSEISKISKRSKKYVWKIANGAELTEEGLKRYRNIIRGVVSQIKPQTDIISVAKARIISHIIFDGLICKSGYNSFVRYINSSKELIEQFIRDVEEVYCLNRPNIEVCVEHALPYYRATFSSKPMYEDLLRYIPLDKYEKYSIPIPREILNGESSLKLAFLTSFFTDEGTISNDGRIMGDLKNELMINQIVSLLNEFGLPFKVIKYEEKNGPIHKIYISKKIQYYQIFYDLDLFKGAIITHGHNLGRRKDAILQMHLEKLKNPQ